MSWHFSLGLAVEYWGDNFWDGVQFAQSKTNPMPSAYCYSDKMTRFSRLSRFGMTFAPLTEDDGKALLTWFQGVFHARTSPQPEKEQGLKVQDQDSGAKWQESLGKLNPNGSLQKTHQCLFPEDSISSSPILPKWGLMRDGELWEQTISEQITKENASGLSLEMWPTPHAAYCGARRNQNGHHLTLQDVVAGHTKEAKTKLQKLNKQMFHTPTATANQMAPSMRKSNYWSTPTANEDARGKPSGKMQKMLGNHPEVRNQGTGTLNPTWVEWLMGWPLGHTDLKPLETDKYQKWLEEHGKY